jgi:hypothetical protein
MTEIHGSSPLGRRRSRRRLERGLQHFSMIWFEQSNITHLMFVFSSAILGGLVGHMPSDETRNSLTLNVPCNE